MTMLNWLFLLVGLVAAVTFVAVAVSGGSIETIKQKIAGRARSIGIAAGVLMLLIVFVLARTGAEVDLQAPSAGVVWAFSKKYWLWILFSLGLAYFLLSVIPKEKEAVEKAGKVQQALVWLAAGLFIAMPLVHLAWGEKTSSPQPEECPPYSSSKVGACTITEEGIFSSPGESVEENVFEFCAVVMPTDSLLLTQWVGRKMLFRSEKGSFSIQYKLIKRNDLIDGKCPEKL
ncbi:MAG: hypothetical protein PHV99_00180 [Candidatus Pacebacteria bacterium]|nr:hypothetical protein [Candidatus Paceibacterota bacterium]